MVYGWSAWIELLDAGEDVVIADSEDVCVVHRLSLAGLVAAYVVQVVLFLLLLSIQQLLSLSLFKLWKLHTACFSVT